MDISQVEKELNATYNLAGETRDTLYYATEDYEKAKLIREQRQAIAIFNGEIEGKNAEQRQAHSQILLIDEFAQENESASNLRQAKLDYDLAMLELSRWKAMLRLLEVQAALETLSEQ